ncbi:hypothetical protein LJC49_05815 [Ruminococcaceae bacterium OttesenSCG-928-I18]|nr:hypothetical protein [Ruminococcaceae bacterium OttesenSCG-928-I18]
MDPYAEDPIQKEAADETRLLPVEKPVFQKELNSAEEGSTDPEQRREKRPLPRVLQTLFSFRPRFEDRGQKRAAGNILRFFAAVLVLTLVARGTAGATIAVVETVKPQSGEILQNVLAEGRVSAAGQTAIIAPEGLTIEEVFVQGGQQVKAGDPLLRFRLSELEELLARQQAALGELRAQLQNLRQSQPVDSSSLTAAQQQLVWAQQDVETIRAQGAQQVAAAQQQLQAAQNAQQNADAALAALPADADPAQRQEAEKTAAEARTAAQTAADALTAAQTEATNSLQEAERAVVTAQQQLVSAQQSDTSARSEAANETNQNQAAAETVRLDIEKGEEKAAELQSLLENEGRLPAPSAGRVETRPAEGTKTSEEPLLHLSNQSQGYLAEALLSEQEAEKLALGARCKVSAEGGNLFYPLTFEGTLTALSAPDEAGRVKASIRLEEGDWKEGDNVRAEFIIEQKNYPLCVPLSALHTDSGGYYLLKTQQEDTVLGMETVLVKVPVTVLAQDTRLAAVESGSLSPSDQIVSLSSKPVAPGDRVKVEVQ